MYYDVDKLCAEYGIENTQAKTFLCCVFETVNALPSKSQAENEIERILEIITKE